jgi:hypothetical protein
VIASIGSSAPAGRFAAEREKEFAETRYGGGGADR